MVAGLRNNKKKNVKGVFLSLHHLLISSSLGETGEGETSVAKGDMSQSFRRR